MAKSKRTVVLFTRWFPYNKAKEQSFLADEIFQLKQRFDRVYLVPQKIEGELFQLPEGIEVDESLVHGLRTISMRTKLRALLSSVFFKELRRVGFNRTKFRYALAAVLAGFVTEQWVRKFKRDHPETCVFYSFWMDASTLGFTLAKRGLPEIKTITRCHNFDLYGNEHNQFYVPFFEYVYGDLNAVFPDSSGGRDFLMEHCPAATLEDGIMGVSAPGYVNKGSTDDIFRIVSCAYMIPRKRIGLFAEGIIQMAKKNPEVKVVWNHIGAGPLWDEINTYVEENKFSNCDIRLLGNMQREEMLAFYRDTPLDLFVNTSTKEGTPVSLMEAISCGIPLMVTRFGGNKEMVERGAGWGLTENPTPEEISDQLLKIIQSNNRSSVREKSIEVWNQFYNSEVNYIRFCDKLEAL